MKVIEIVIPAGGAIRLSETATQIRGTVLIFAPPSNTAPVTYGDVAFDIDRLLPGDPAKPIEHPKWIDLSAIWARGTPNDKIRVGHFGEWGMPA